MSGEADQSSNLFDRLMRNTRTAGRLFVTIFVIAAGLAAVTVWLASSGAGAGGEVRKPLAIVIDILVIDGGLIIGLVALVGSRMIAVLRSREAGSRLHLRYMSLFALAAAVPAVVIASFFGLLVTRGINSWFSTRMETMVNSYGSIAQAVWNNESERLNGDIGATSIDLNRDIGVLRRSREVFEQQVLRPQMSQRGFNSIRVIDAQGRVLAEVTSPHAGAYVPPTPKTYIDADAAVGPQCQTPAPKADCSLPSPIAEDTGIATVLFPLAGSNHPYVLVEAPTTPGLYANLQKSSDAITQYRAVGRTRADLQALFVWIYLETVLLVLLGAVWLGMAVAHSISEPVAKLIEAANRVAGGLPVACHVK